jgi:tetratricopeptide (TPR) repeat protein
VYDGGCGFYGYSSPAVIPPAALYVRADAAYGPDAMKEFMGVDRDFAKGPLAPSRTIIVERPADAAATHVVAAPKKNAAPKVEFVKEPVASNADARARAARLIALGDEQFGGQQFHSAAQRYRLAAEAAPDVADAHFRQGFAYLASNRHDQAVAAFRRGLAIDPLWVNSSFRLDDLYDGAGLAKSSHIDGLARTALENRSKSDYYFLIGLVLHFDGQQDRAKRFFERAQKLSGADKSHIQVFLKPPAPLPKDAV